MTYLRNFFYAVPLAALAAAFSSLPSLWSQQPGTGRVGVLNLEEVMARLQKAKDLQGYVDANAKARKSQIEQLDQQVQDLLEKLQIICFESETRRKTTEELIKLDALKKYHAEQLTREIQEGQKQNTVQLYNDIREECDRFGRESGYELILKADTARLDFHGRDDVNQEMNRRVVLYYGGAQDVSDLIVRSMNERYAREKADRGVEQQSGAPGAGALPGRGGGS